MFGNGLDNETRFSQQLMRQKEAIVQQFIVIIYFVCLFIAIDNNKRRNIINLIRGRKENIPNLIIIINQVQKKKLFWSIRWWSVKLKVENTDLMNLWIPLYIEQSIARYVT